jgi:uncharacterized repeat protein (TIGR01451 family)
MDGLAANSVMAKRASIPWRRRDVIAAASRAVARFAACFAVRRGSRRSASAWPVLVLAFGVAAAQEAEAPGSTLELMTVVEKVVVAEADGAERAALVPASVLTSLRGDELIYTVSFANVGVAALDHVRITAPIPLEVQYVAGSAFASGSEALYSVDGGQSFGQPGELYVGVVEGSRRLAVADDYTHIRWVLRAPLGPGAKGFARFRAVLR